MLCGAVCESEPASTQQKPHGGLGWAGCREDYWLSVGRLRKGPCQTRNRHPFVSGSYISADLFFSVCFLQAGVVLQLVFVAV